MNQNQQYGMSGSPMPTQNPGLKLEIPQQDKNLYIGYLASVVLLVIGCFMPFVAMKAGNLSMNYISYDGDLKDGVYVIGLLVVAAFCLIKNKHLVSALLHGIGVAIFAYVLVKNPYFLAEDTCLDAGNVWDDDEKRCRDDCLKWNKDYGCIQITQEQRMLSSRGKRIPVAVYKDICLSNQKAWNNDKSDCDFYFVSANCGNLSGNWEYPDSCLKEN